MITSDRMAAIDRNAAALGVPQRSLMEASGNAIARAVRSVATVDDPVTILVGRGNNGGDGMVAARYLEEFRVSVVLVGHPDRLTGELPRTNWEVLERAHVNTSITADSTAIEPPDGAIVVDALLGTGVVGRIREPIRSAIEAINESDAHVVSVDVPSGADPDATSIEGLAVDADTVVTFHDVKPIHDVLQTTVRVESIGIPRAAERFVGPGDVARVTARAPLAHKGDHGRVLVIGGGPFVGAPALAAAAALRAGADLAEVAAPESGADTIAGYREDLIVRPVPGDRFEPTHLEMLADALARADVVAIGPGLGDDPETHAAVRSCLERYEGIAVVDADALTVLTEVEPRADIIATPHRREFEELGFAAPDDWTAALEVVSEAAKALNATVLLKGRYDVTSDGTTTRVNRTGNPGMTVGGTGDVLTGAVAALSARTTPIEATAVGAWANGRAGDRCRDESGYGFLASDVVEALPAAFSDLDGAPI